MRFNRDFFEQEPVALAQALLGHVLVHSVAGKRLAGRIMETEAYLTKDDAAAHVAYGKKASIRALEKGPGTLYIHPMRQYVGMDIVAKGGSVLLRGLEPLENVEGLLDGPGKLTRALGITRAYDGCNLLDVESLLWLEEGLVTGEIVAGPRVGITRDVELPLRFRVVR